jgi:PEP-CTERM motif
MFRFTVLGISPCAALILTLLSSPAQATPTMVPDPFIGIRGGDDSDSALDATPRQLAPCTGFGDGFGVEGLSDFFCAAFFLLPNDLSESSSLFSVGMIWWDASGIGIPNCVGDGCEEDNFFVAPDDLSDFNGIQRGGVLGDDGFLVTLFSNDGNLQFPVIGCDDVVLECSPSLGSLHFLLFSSQNGFVSSQEINGVRNANADLFPGTTALAVPEPATLVLLGAGLLGTAARRKRQQRGSRRV